MSISENINNNNSNDFLFANILGNEAEWGNTKRRMDESAKPH